MTPGSGNTVAIEAVSPGVPSTPVATGGVQRGNTGGKARQVSTTGGATLDPEIARMIGLLPGIGFAVGCAVASVQSPLLTANCLPDPTAPAPANAAGPAAPAALVVTPAQLAEQAEGLLVLPSPKPSRYPNGVLRDSGHPYTLVKANTWFWTDPATFKPVSKTVTAAAVSATATATPVSLWFDPGDGSAPVTCPGPGSGWTPNDQAWLAPVNPDGCSYVYRHTSAGIGGDDQVTATYAITWTVTWRGSDGTSGRFDGLQTQTTSRFAVAEAQTVIIR